MWSLVKSSVLFHKLSLLAAFCAHTVPVAVVVCELLVMCRLHQVKFKITTFWATPSISWCDVRDRLPHYSNSVSFAWTSAVGAHPSDYSTFHSLQLNIGIVALAKDTPEGYTRLGSNWQSQLTGRLCVSLV